MKTLLYIFFTCFTSNLLGQNLIKNPGFETYNTSENGSGIVDEQFDYFQNNTKENKLISANYWYKSDLSTPDLIINANREKNKGKVSLGLLTYCEKDNYREFARGSLLYPLIKGNKYKFSISVKKGEHYKHGSNISLKNLDFLFTSKELKDNPYFQYWLYKPTVSLNISEITSEWIIIEKTFIAYGNEMQFIIGNFDIDPEYSNSKEDKKIKASYYVLDNLELVDLGNISNPESGTYAVLDSVYFDAGKASVKKESYNQLDLLAKVLVKHPELNTKITGHTDRVGNAELNKRLSLERAEAVKSYLQNKGVNENQITCFGYGSAKPRFQNNRQNRRVEVEWIKN